MKILSGTFQEGCGVLIYDEATDEYYHKVVLLHKEKLQPFVEFNKKEWFLEDFQNQSSTRKSL